MAPENSGKNAMQSCERLIIALDFDSREEALALVKLLGERIGTYKIGYQLFMREGMSFVKELVRLGKKVFLDLKMGDIDRTIAAALRAVPEGVEFVTINGGKATVAAAKEGRGERDRPLILSLTFLSSLDQDDLRAFMMNENLELDEYVRVFTRRSIEAGCDGVVASGESIREIRQEFGSRLVIVAPGIRPQGIERNDHKRALTPTMAIEYGADYLVVGRPVTEAENNLEIAENLIEEVNCAVVMNKIRPTDENLRRFGVELLMKWLIAATENETTLTYGKVKDRLEQECNFSSMGNSGSRRIGKAVAEPMQAEIRKQDSNAPPLNVLVVREKDRVPGSGECIREIFSAHFPDEAWLKNEYALEEHPEKWKKIVERATREVYDYPHWKDIYEKIYGKKLGL